MGRYHIAMYLNCSVAIAVWIALAGGYFYLLRAVPGNDKFFGAFGMATVVWIGLALIHGVRYSIADWRAKRRLARGERPHDGDLAAAIGPVSAGFETLRAPFTGRDCVLYEYNIGPSGTGEGRPARDYVGFGMTRCTVRTPYGDVALGSFPVLEHIFETTGDRAAAEEYVANTTFEQAGGMQMVKAIIGVHSLAPPLKKDWILGTPSDIHHSIAEEKIIAPGETITAFGRYVAASNAIVSDTKRKGFLRVRRGGDAIHAPSIPWNAIGGFLGGIAIVVAANLVFYLLRRS